MATSIAHDAPASIARRHDLDALRAVAMLMGIVLHGAMSFIPGVGAFWGVQDSQSHEAFGVLLSAIHGFRMPLFFLVSGFFTAMLWRKRGLEALLFHRFKRIFLPMLIALLTIIPATWIMSLLVKAGVANDRSAHVANDYSAGISAAKKVDIVTAATLGDVESVKLQIQEGADVATMGPDGSTALHGSIFFGHVEVTEMLLDAGADPTAVNNNGDRACDGIHAPWGVTKFIADMLSITVEQEQVEQGREQIAKLFKERGIELGEGPSDQDKLIGLVKLLLFFPLFGHLWFLWFLCWLVGGFALCVAVGKSMGVRGLPTWMTLSVWRYAWLIPITAIPQFFMGQAGNSFGPDTSIGLFPIPTVLGYYAIFFAFGAFYYEADDQSGRVGRWWWIALPVALFALFPLGLAASSVGETPNRVVFVLCQVLYAWVATFGMMGLFRSLLSRESKTMRYVSDSSYWLYLAHIPLIILVQYLVYDWSMPAIVKFAIVCIVTSGLLLISYQLFVRYTPIGTLLNGPRRRMPKVEEAVDAIIVEAAPVGEASSS